MTEIYHQRKRPRLGILLSAMSLMLLSGCGKAGASADYNSGLSPAEIEAATEEKGWEYFKQAKFDDSIKQYKAILQRDPNSANAHYGLASVYQQLDKNDEAFKEYAEAIRLNPEHTGCYNDRGNLYDSVGEYEKAIADYSKAIELEDWNAANYNDRAGTYMSLKKPDLALKDATEAVIRDGNYVNPHYYRGLAYYWKDDYKNALIALRYALDCEPALVRAHSLMGHIYLDSGYARKAIDHYTQAIALSPKTAVYYSYRGAAFEKLGKNHEAELDYKKALQLDPKNEDAKEGLEKVEFESSARALTKPQLFAVACCAVLDKYNDAYLDKFLPYTPTEENKEKERKSLQKWWGINNAADLHNCLANLETGGHRRLYDEIAVALASKDPGAYAALESKWGSRYSKEELKLRRMFVEQFKDRLGKKSLIGWDMIRYIHLCRWGALAGYMTEDEAWQKIMPVAKRLQGTFDSWQDLGTNYLEGRSFWNPDIPKEERMVFYKNFEWLSTSPDSPWQKVSWTTKL
ncbi:MAG: DUF1266 domain-containing protein [Cyanobacteria bacterium HKST-UBA01]|nr:DUF1266 domain-containing protein [Cyanobacteria bacterium HKST-UBA01]